MVGTHWRVLAVLLAVLVLAAACGSSGEVKVGASASGGQVELEQGQVLVVTLESNPSTGFRWEVVDLDESILQQVGEAEFEVADDRDPPPPGAGGHETFRFQAVGVGQTSLQMIYHRSWEEGVEPERTFSLQVAVK